MLGLVVNIVVIIIAVLISVAFITLFERRILGYVHIRRGPNKVGIVGVFQPFGDAVKLFCKEYMGSFVVNYYIFYFTPVLGLFLILSLWVIIPLGYGLFDYIYGVLFFISLVGLGVYVLLGSGWSSNCSYSLLGGLRAVAQTISYEVSLVLLLLRICFYGGGYCLETLGNLQELCYFGVVFFPVMMPFFISLLAETNRTPFDFAEGESELVSGFNVEYGGVGFSLLFMAEYGMILFIRRIFVILFLGGLDETFCLKIGILRGVFL
jgi:NADH-ubiquinone oxidoreductase chain 1